AVAYDGEGLRRDVGVELDDLRGGPSALHVVVVAGVPPGGPGAAGRAGQRDAQRPGDDVERHDRAVGDVAGRRRRAGLVRVAAATTAAGDGEAPGHDGGQNGGRDGGERSETSGHGGSLGSLWAPVGVDD